MDRYVCYGPTGAQAKGCPRSLELQKIETFIG